MAVIEVPGASTVEEAGAVYAQACRDFDEAREAVGRAEAAIREARAAAARAQSARSNALEQLIRMAEGGA